MTTEGIILPGVSVGGSGAGAADRPHRPPATSLAASCAAALQRHPGIRNAAVDIGFILIAVLDVWLVVPEQAQPYSVVLSAASCVALVARRWLPFAVVLATVPGFFAGWAQLAAMIALGSLAVRKQAHWHVAVGAALVWACRFVLWPLPDFVAMTWREHVLDAIYGMIVAGMPLAIGLLIGVRSQLSTRLTELAASRDRERQLHAHAARAEERARLAREMHDVVSHDITLIAMQAGALTALAPSEELRNTAQTIRTLSTRTLEELRGLVGVLRSDTDTVACPRLGDLDRLIRIVDVPVRLAVGEVPDDLPVPVSTAAYRTVQECLTNVRKHAPGATVCVRIEVRDGTLRVEVENGRPRKWGTGLPSGGHGLTGLAERARLLGGTFDARSTGDGGFRVTACYPISR